MRRSKIFTLVPFASFVAMLVYFFTLSAIGDARVKDMKLEGNEMHWFEALWVSATICGVLFVWFRSAWRAFHLGKTGWAIAIVFFWPAAAAYIWKHE